MAPPGVQPAASLFPPRLSDELSLSTCFFSRPIFQRYKRPLLYNVGADSVLATDMLTTNLGPITACYNRNTTTRLAPLEKCLLLILVALLLSGCPCILCCRCRRAAVCL